MFLIKIRLTKGNCTNLFLFRRNLSLPNTLIRQIYYDSPSAKYLRWFYTSDEIDDSYLFHKSLDLYGDNETCNTLKKNSKKIRSSPRFSSEKQWITAATIKPIEVSVDSLGLKLFYCG